MLKRFQHADDSYTSLTSDATPPDFAGRMAVALDYRGQPQYLKATATANELTNCPYNAWFRFASRESEMLASQMVLGGE